MLGSFRSSHSLFSLFSHDVSLVIRLIIRLSNKLTAATTTFESNKRSSPSSLMNCLVQYFRKDFRYTSLRICILFQPVVTLIKTGYSFIFFLPPVNIIGRIVRAQESTKQIFFFTLLRFLKITIANKQRKFACSQIRVYVFSLARLKCNEVWRRETDWVKRKIVCHENVDARSYRVNYTIRTFNVVLQFENQSDFLYVAFDEEKSTMRISNPIFRYCNYKCLRI